MILISKVRTSASKKINLMALIRTLTISTTTFERMKENSMFFGRLNSVRRMTFVQDSSFRLKTRIWGQNYKNMNNCGVKTGTLFVIRGYISLVERNLSTKFYLSKRSVNRIEQVNICCHGNVNHLSQQQGLVRIMFRSLHLWTKPHVHDIHNTWTIHNYVIKKPPLCPRASVTNKKSINLDKGHTITQQRTRTSSILNSSQSLRAWKKFKGPIRLQECKILSFHWMRETVHIEVVIVRPDFHVNISEQFTIRECMRPSFDGSVMDDTAKRGLTQF